MKFILTSLLFLTALSAHALMDVNLNDPTLTTSYEIMLTYDDAKQILLPPTSTTSAYHIVRKDFVPSSGKTDFLGILVGPKGKEYQRFTVPLPEKILTGKKITYTVPAPYHPSGEQIDLYHGSVKLFAIDVSGSRLCVEDGMCLFDAGENDLNCPVDCANLPTPTPPPTAAVPTAQPTLPAELPPVVTGSETSRASSGSSSTLVLSLVFFGLGLLSFGLWAYLRKKRHST